MRMIWLSAMLFVAPSVQAQLSDPTRPPAQLITPEAGGVAAVPVESGMQTVIVRRRGKSGAVINGQYVEVGSKLGDKRVIRISESEVVLNGAGGREVIRLIPSIEKTPVVKTAVQPAVRRRATGISER